MLNESLIYLYHSWLHEKDENIIGSKFSNFGLMIRISHVINHIKDLLSSFQLLNAFSFDIRLLCF